MPARADFLASVISPLTPAPTQATLVAMLSMHPKFEGRRVDFVPISAEFLASDLLPGVDPDIGMQQYPVSPVPGRS